MTDQPADALRRPGDVAADRLALLRSTAIVATGYAVGASVQSAYVYARLVPEWADVPLWTRLVANIAAVVVLIAAMWALRVYRWSSWPRMVAGAAIASAACSVTRYLLQLGLDVYVHPGEATRDSELIAGFVIAMVSAVIGVWAVFTRRRSRAAVRRAERDVVHVELAVRALEDEEIRVRREVAEGLHGTLQSKLVVVDARLAELAAHGAASGWSADDLATIGWVRDELEVSREIDVRQMSRILYPDRLELGLVPAVRALLGRLPATIATRLTASPQVRVLDDPAQGTLTVNERLLAVRVVEEAVTNALKNGLATSIAVALSYESGELRLLVENDGALFDPDSAGVASGTARLRDRLSLVGGRVELRPGDAAGARLEAWLPLGRA